MASRRWPWLGVPLLWLVLAAGVIAAGVQAATTPADAELEARMLALTAQMRCLVCQNDSVAHSSAPLAADLRRDVLERLHRGEDEAQIAAALRQRYGDALFYRPPLRTGTLLLWLAPAVLLIAGLGAWAGVLRRRARPGPPGAPDSGL
ncbi:cytochrome c-type biogenesis protein [Caldimonas sp. KR1-144]|uniref:cytochrome c-type biogenesis protein n=1 Tax=Caldimonas sp. KR1-144 TaxID=3400911 RepID=UPI003C0A0137